MHIFPKIVLLVETSREFGRSILDGIAKYSRINGPWSFFRYPPYYLQSGDWKRVLSWLRRLVADGILMRENEHVREVVELGLPMIVLDVNEEIPGISNIVTNETAIGGMAADHLIELGFRRFGFCGFDDVLWSRKRCKSFCRTVRSSRYDCHIFQQPKYRTHRSGEKEQHPISRWLESLPKPVGLMACNHDCAQHVLEACKLTGLKVPEQIAIIGADNDKLVCGLADPPLSSIALNTQKAGYEAAKSMAKMIVHKKIRFSRILVHPTHVVERRSTDVLAVSDDLVASAINYINQHANRVVSVEDVAAAVGLSRRMLHNRFKQAIGRSIHDEIKRVRIQQAIRMLVETNMTVTEIALAMGYSGPEKLSRYFQRETGATPLAYRKKIKN